MMQRVRNVQYTGDPLTLPARGNEIEFLVRIFYKLSHFINEKVIITATTTSNILSSMFSHLRFA